MQYLDEVHGRWLGRGGWLDFPARAVGYGLTWNRAGIEEGYVNEEEVFDVSPKQVLGDNEAWEEIGIDLVT